MGQQQLLLLVLGIVIVGLAVVVGINAFSENRVKSNADALVTDGLRIASDIQAWALKPTQFGGGNNGSATGPDDALSNCASGTTGGNACFDEIGYNTGGSAYTNVNGEFTIGNSLGSECTAPTIPSGETAIVYITADNADTGNQVCIALAGTNSEDIGTDVHYGS